MAEETLRVNDRLSVFLRAWAPKGSPRGVVGLDPAAVEAVRRDPLFHTKVSIVLHCAPEKDEVLAFIAGWMDTRAA
jgi:hypothetical protein